MIPRRAVACVLLIGLACTPKNDAKDSAPSATASVAPTASAPAADVVSSASVIWDGGAPVVAGGEVDGDALRTKSRARIAGDKSAVTILTGTKGPLDPADRNKHWEIEVGPLGHFLDIAIDRSTKKSDVAWSSASAIKTKIDRDKKLVAIDVSVRSPDVIAVLKNGARLPMGLYRMEGKAPNRLFLAWSPTRTPKPDFHVPSMFGTLILD
jgi:hypothetical protein